MPSLRYLHLDVFTSRALEGNQLAVYPSPLGLDAAAMQSLAREMNFSETTFVLPAEDPSTEARLRIFTPAGELPMAGHPVIGSTFALAHQGVIRSDRERFVFGLGVGPTPVALEWRGSRLDFAWMTQPLPRFGGAFRKVDRLAAALGVASEAIMATGLPVEAVSCGVPYLLVPLATRRDVDAAEADPRGLREAFAAEQIEEQPVFLFSTEPVEPGVTAYSRMFAPGFGIVEDPATGSASGSLGAYLVRHRAVAESDAGSMLSLQGVKMKRPSRIHIAIRQRGEEIAEVRVGGQSIIVAEGTLTI